MSNGGDGRPPPLPPSWARDRMGRRERSSLQRVTDSVVSYVQAIYAFIYLLYTVTKGGGRGE